MFYVRGAELLARPGLLARLRVYPGTGPSNRDRRKRAAYLYGVDAGGAVGDSSITKPTVSEGGAAEFGYCS
jgi:hypothetical protein